MRCAPLCALLALACSAPPPHRLEPAARPEPAPPPELSVRWVGDADDATLPLLVLMHGYGAPGDDLVPLGESLRASLGGELRVALPAALLDLGHGRAWWHIVDGPRPADRSDERPAGLDEARDAVTSWLDAQVAAGTLEPSRTVIAGFSQGGMLATEVGMAWEHRAGGIVSLSGGPLDSGRWIARAARAPPLLLSHGRSDPLLSFAAAERLRAQLTGAGATVTWVPFEGFHEIPPRVVSALVEFLRR